MHNKAIPLTVWNNFYEKNVHVLGVTFTEPFILTAKGLRARLFRGRATLQTTTFTKLMTGDKSSQASVALQSCIQQRISLRTVTINDMPRSENLIVLPEVPKFTTINQMLQENTKTLSRK